MAQRRRGATAGVRAARRLRPEPTPAPAQTQVGGGDLTSQRGRLRSVVEPVVLAAGLDLEEFALRRVGRRYVVRVTVDCDGGVAHDVLGTVSREISDALDAAEAAGGELIADSYTLEVSSPGVDRPLVLPRHWRRNIGRVVRVRAGGRLIVARIVAADDTGVALDVDGSRQAFGFGQLGPGRVQVEFAGLAEAGEEDLGDRSAADDDYRADRGGGDDDLGVGPHPTEQLSRGLGGGR